MLRTILFAVIAVINLIAFALMGIDKRRARKGAWRIPEKMLFLPTILFGGLGGTLGMFFFRHKTKHWYFRIFFPVLLVIQLFVLVWAMYTVL
ncbi:MAG: DUF1294 domain-containing protein [Clostridia bacterium]|nr:DUF1294 domain-containing protein [Clostridia bacterium]